MTLESIARTDTLVNAMAIEVRLELTVLGQSQAALAKALGVPAMWVSDRLTGRVQLTIPDAARITDVLGLKLSALIERAERRLGERVTRQYPQVDLDGLLAAPVGNTPVPALAAAHAHPLPGGPISPERRWSPPSGQRRPTPLRSPIG